MTDVERLSRSQYRLHSLPSGAGDIWIKTARKAALAIVPMGRAAMLHVCGPVSLGPVCNAKTHATVKAAIADGEAMLAELARIRKAKKATKEVSNV